AGSPRGQALLAFILSYGPGSLRDLEEARQWYARSAAAGCPEGNLGYALSLAQRATSDTDQQQVAEHIRRAAEAQLPTAVYLLALLTERGEGIPRDPVRAVQLYQEAAEKGHRSAQVRWGLELVKGENTQQDRIAGESWLRRSALAGDPDGAFWVGDLYAQSGPLPPNYPEAANWYRR